MGSIPNGPFTSELHLMILVNTFQPREFCEHFPFWMAINYATSVLTPESWTHWKFLPCNITFHPSVTCLNISPPLSQTSSYLYTVKATITHWTSAQSSVKSSQYIKDGSLWWGEVHHDHRKLITWKLIPEETSGGLQSIYLLFYSAFVTHYKRSLVHPLDKLLTCFDRLLWGRHEVLSVTGYGEQVLQHLKGHLLNLLQFINIFLIFEVQQENRTLVLPNKCW